MLPWCSLPYWVLGLSLFSTVMRVWGFFSILELEERYIGMKNVAPQCTFNAPWLKLLPAHIRTWGPFRTMWVQSLPSFSLLPGIIYKQKNHPSHEWKVEQNWGLLWVSTFSSEIKLNILWGWKLLTMSIFICCYLSNLVALSSFFSTFWFMAMCLSSSWLACSGFTCIPSTTHPAIFQLMGALFMRGEINSWPLSAQHIASLQQFLFAMMWNFQIGGLLPA